jgi:hypothetical protein
MQRGAHNSRLTGVRLIVLVGVVLLLVGVGLASYRVFSSRQAAQTTPGPLFTWTARYASGPVLLSADLSQIMAAKSRSIASSACQFLEGDLSKTAATPAPPDPTLASDYRTARAMMTHLTSSCLRHEGAPSEIVIHDLAQSAQHQLGLMLKVLDTLPTQR